MRRRIEINEQQLRNAVANCQSIAEVCKQTGQNKSKICREMKRLGIGMRDQTWRVGQQHGDWTIIEVFSLAKRTCCMATCVCGAMHKRHLSSIVSGASKSCGCKIRKKLPILTTKHGMRSSAEYLSWLGMKSRCLNKNASNYKYYGALGVQVCDRWRESFASFFEDMGPKPSKQHTIDRINPFGDYEPSNCRWATKVEQSQNQRRKHA